MLLILALACHLSPSPEPASEQRGAPERISTQRVRIQPAAEGSWLSLDLLVTDAMDGAVPCDASSTRVRVSYSTASSAGPWTRVSPAEVLVDCAPPTRGGMALVLDNSGSLDGFMPQLQAGASAMMEGVLAAGGQSSLVRVSTDASLVVPLTSEAEALRQGIDAMAVSGGWTALWDGVRLGNESLGAGGSAPESLEDFCGEAGSLGVVAFTDGQDNNSSGEQDYDHQRYPGDGLDTHISDLVGLRSGGALTPLYSIGLGDQVDAEALSGLAESTGARFLAVEEEADLAGAFGLVSDYFEESARVCSELPVDTCGTVWVKVEAGRGSARTTTITEVELDCALPAEGSSATLLLTLSDPGIDPELAGRMAGNTLRAVTPVEDPQVLVVLDDNHHGEDLGDAAYVADLLDAQGYEICYLVEPEGGLTDADLAPHDVVWLSNPGYPPDDYATIQALERFLAAGGGVVLQGDDMSWSWGGAFSMSPLTHLQHLDNGTSDCGQSTDNDEGSYYEVALADSAHPLLQGISGRRFLYGNDIDHSLALGEGEQVMATATLEGGGCDTWPVWLLHQP